MEQVSKTLSPIQISLEYGKIVSKAPGILTVETDAGSSEARRAVNCLVDPEPGDLVLLSEDSFGRRYVLSVLEKEAGAAVSIGVENDLDLRVPNGRLRAAARDGVDLAAARDLNLTAPKIELSAQNAKVAFDQMEYVGSHLEAHVERIKLFGATCHSAFERVSQRVKRSYRWVAEIDQLQAGHLNYLIKELLNVRGKYSVITAEKDVRIDGDKIMMG